MQKHTRYRIALALPIMLATPALCSAAGGFIGLGVSASPDYEGSEDYEGAPAVFGRYVWDTGRYIDLGGAPSTGSAARLSANLLAAGEGGTRWEMGPLLQYRMERDDVDNDKVDDMKKVDSTVEAGAFVGFKSGHWEAQLSFAADVNSEYDGYLVYLNGAYNMEVNDKLKLKFGARTSYADDDYMDAYFGVSSADAARSGLSTYSADEGMKDVGLNLTANYAFNKKWGLIGVVSYNRLLGDAEDSPLVDDEGDKNQLGATLAVTYSF